MSGLLPLPLEHTDEHAVCTCDVGREEYTVSEFCPMKARWSMASEPGDHIYGLLLKDGADAEDESSSGTDEFQGTFEHRTLE